MIFVVVFLYLGATGDHVNMEMYPGHSEDFAGANLAKLDIWVFDRVTVRQQINFYLTVHCVACSVRFTGVCCCMLSSNPSSVMMVVDLNLLVCQKYVMASYECFVFSTYSRRRNYLVSKV